MIILCRTSQEKCKEMAVRYDLLSYEKVVEEYDEPEIGAGANVYKVFKLK